MNVWEFMGEHPILTVVLALIAVSAIPSFYMVRTKK